MNYEKKYKESLERAKIWQNHLYECGDKGYADELNYIFPELKESEDEKSKNWILEYLYDGLRKSDEQFKGQFKAAIAWLEKQGTTIKFFSDEFEWALGRIIAFWNKNHKDGIYDENELMSYVKVRETELIKLFTDNVCKVSLSDCSEEYRKAYYDGYNKCDRDWLKKQDEPIEINPTEFDTRLQNLVGQFDKLPKEELVGCLSFWLNVVQNDGTYKSDEKQGEQSIQIVPSRETILSIWDLGNEWKELTHGSISTEHGTQLEYIQKHWEESEYYLREKQGEQKLKKIEKKNINVGHEYFSDLLERDDSDNIDDYAYQCAYCMSHDWEKDTATWKDVENACKLGAQWKYQQMTKNAEKISGIKIGDKIEPKFKVGDWVIGRATNNEPRQIAEITDQGYKCIYGEWYGFSWEDDIHLWTIQDAKDGDVLTSIGFHSNCTFIFDGLDNWKFDEPNGDRAVATGHCCITASSDKIEFGIQGPDCIEVNSVKPATKIQRDLLFQKMKEAGYEWDADKKELKKIESDKKDMIEALRTEYEKGKADAIAEMQKPAEWSEEDDNCLSTIIAEFSKCAGKSVSKDEWMRCNDFLNSLKPQNNWKPSDEQIRALANALSLAKNCGEESSFDLRKLYEQLKKLAE